MPRSRGADSGLRLAPAIRAVPALPAPPRAPVPGPSAAIPPLPAVTLARTALVARLVAAPGGSVATVSASPGYGRTTLLALVARQRPEPTAYVPLSPLHADPQLFWRAVLGALRAAGGDLPAREPRPPAAGDDPGPFLVRLVEQLAGSPALHLALDDVDERVHAGAMESLLAFAEALPASVTLTLSLRRGLPRRLARLRTAGRLVSIDEADLVLAPAEAGELVAGLAPALAPERREALVSAAHGWAAGIVEALAAAAPAGEEDPAAWLRGPGVDALFEPMVDELAAADLDFLMRVSVLPTLTPGACDAVVPGAGSAQRLARLHRERCYLRLTQPDTPEYRVFPLFAAFLRSHLAAAGTGVQRDAHRRAARWFSADGRVEESIEQWLAARDVGEASALLEANVQRLLDDGRADTVRRWYDAMGESRAQGLLQLLGQAWSRLLAGDAAGAQAPIADLDRAFRRVPVRVDGDRAAPAPPPDRSAAWLATEMELLRAYQQGWNGYPRRMGTHADRARTAYGTAWGRNAQLAVLLAARAALWTGDPSGARDVLAVLRDRPRSDSAFASATFVGAQAWVAQMEGRAYRARRQASDARQWLDRAGSFAPSDRLDAVLAHSGALLDLADVAGAESDARRVVREADRIGHVAYAVLGRLALAGALAARTSLAEALVPVAQARELIRVHAPGSELSLPLLTLEARLRIDAGDAIRAERLLATLPAGASGPLLPVRLAQLRRPTAGVPELRAVRPRHPREAAEVSLLLAAALLDPHPREAQRLLLAAADLAEEWGMLRLLAGAAEPLRAYAERLARRTGHDGLLRMVAAAQPGGTAPPSSAPRLSAGELELLSLLPTAAGNDELAAGLSVSLNTVKTRLRRLYAKLGVHSRAEAVQRGHELGLLPATQA